MPLIVPYLGGLAALLVYNTLIVRARQWEEEEKAEEEEDGRDNDESRKGEKGRGVGLANLAFLPDMEKSQHFDGTFCHRYATFY